MRVLGVAVLLASVGAPLAVACGARTPLDLGAATPAPGPDASSPVDAGASLVPSSFCTVDPEGDRRVIAAAIAGSTISFVNGRGVVTTPYTFPSPASGMFRWYGLIASRGSYVAAATVDDGMATGIVRVVLLDVTGRVVFEGAYPMPYENYGEQASLVGNASGLFVVTTWAGSHHLGVTFSPNGATSWTEPYLAQGDPDDDGALLVLQDGNSTQDLYWLETAPTPQVFKPTQLLDAGPTSGASQLGDGLAYLTSAPAVFWRETATGRSSLALGSAWGPMAYPLLEVASAPSWALACSMSSSNVEHVTRFDVLGRAPATTFDITPPAGWSLDETPGLGEQSCPSVDSQGNAMVGLVAPSGIVQVQSTVDGSHWTPLGQPMTGVDYADAVESAGTYLLGGMAANGYPTPDPDGGSAGVVAGAHMQLVRPASHTSVVLADADWANQTYPLYWITADGGCVAFFTNGALAITNASSGSTFTTSVTAHTNDSGLGTGWTNVPGDGQVGARLGY